MTILISKVTRPAPPPHILDRPRLYARLDQVQTLPVAFVHAPAGYGKSILVSRWLEVRELERRTAWYSLDPGDNDPVQFVRYLAAALGPVAPASVAAVQPVLDAPEPHPLRALEMLLSTLPRAPHASDSDPWLLVLDDLHQADSAALAPLMTLMLERRPPQLHFLLLMRPATYGPLTRLYAAGQVLPIDAEDLRFRPAEIEAYLVKHGFVALSAENLAQLTAGTEGWIVALQLLVANAGKTREIDGLLLATKGRRGWLAQYLTTQILAALSPEQNAFLLRTSILARFNVALATAVTGNQAADGLLATMIKAGLPVVQLDSRQEWFRYHHLFQELLQTQLQQEVDGAAIAALHRRAATWLAEHEQITAAVQHALAADDLPLAAAILEAAVRPEIVRGGTHQAEKWLALLPDGTLDQHPRLLLDRCLLGVLGVQVNLMALVGRADVALASAQMTDKERQHVQDEQRIYTIYAQFYKRNFACVKELVRDAEQRLAAAEPLTRALLLYIQQHIAWYAGQEQTALAKAHQAIKACRDAGFDQLVISVRRNLAQLSAHYGSTRAALTMLQETTAAAPANRAFAINELAETHVSAMVLCYWVDDMAGAAREQQSALALARRLGDPVLIRQIDAMAVLFAMARATDEPIEIKDSCPIDTMGSDMPLNRLHLHLLVRQGQIERAWHFVAGFGVQIDGEILPENLSYFVSLLEITIARGVDLEGIAPRLAAAMAHAEDIHSRFLAAGLHALSSWCHLRLGRQEEAERDLHQALDLAEATGYVRFILDIPALAPLLAVLDHPTAAEMWVATVSAAQRRQAAQLTDQERLVLTHLVGPASYQEIADELGVSINTVRTHIRHIYAKLSVHNRKDAVARAQALGLTPQKSPCP